jgi:hypothetical protein
MCWLIGHAAGTGAESRHMQSRAVAATLLAGLFSYGIENIASLTLKPLMLPSSWSSVLLSGYWLANSGVRRGPGCRSTRSLDCTCCDRVSKSLAKLGSRLRGSCGSPRPIWPRGLGKAGQIADT